MLELKSLENDNAILDRRLRELTSVNGALKNENRELRAANSRLELERLQLKKDAEGLKNDFSMAQNEATDLSEKLETIKTENERVKNELFTANKKLEIFGAVDKTHSRLTEPVDLALLKEKAPQLKTPKGSIPAPKRPGSPQKTHMRTNLASELEKLNFDGLIGLEERLKQLNR